MDLCWEERRTSAPRRRTCTNPATAGHPDTAAALVVVDNLQSQGSATVDSHVKLKKRRVRPNASIKKVTNPKKNTFNVDGPKSNMDKN